MRKELVERVTALVDPILADMSFELIDVEYLTEHGRWVLRITADKPGGITLDDCARISRELGDVLDVKELIPHEYVLEVSSPGLNRPLKREADFVRAVGKPVSVKMFSPVQGRRNFSGVLRGVKNDVLDLSVEGRTFLLPLKDVKKANLKADVG